MKHIGYKIEENQVFHQFLVDERVVLSVAPLLENGKMVGVVDDLDGMHLNVVYADTMIELAELARQQA